MKKTCKEYSDGVKRAAGWAFAHMLNFYYGNTAIVLAEEGPSKEDLEFAATDLWLEANHAKNFGIKKEDSSEFSEHVETCPDSQCQEASRRLHALSPFFQEGKLPGSPELALTSVLESKRYGSAFYIQRGNGFGRAIDEIKPFIEWFTKDKDFWIWP